MDFDQFKEDDKTTSAVIRKLEIIGEATKHIPQDITQKYPTVPWKEMAGMRDKLIHFYYDVDEWEFAVDIARHTVQTCNVHFLILRHYFEHPRGESTSCAEKGSDRSFGRRDYEWGSDNRAWAS